MRRSRRAFTLLEAVLVLGLVGLLAGSVYTFLWNLLAHRDALMRESSDARAAAAVVERMERDMLAGMVGDQTVGAGVAGDQRRLELLSRGGPALRAGDPA